VGYAALEARITLTYLRQDAARYCRGSDLRDDHTADNLQTIGFGGLGNRRDCAVHRSHFVLAALWSAARENQKENGAKAILVPVGGFARITILAREKTVASASLSCGWPGVKSYPSPNCESGGRSKA